MPVQEIIKKSPEVPFPISPHEPEVPSYPKSSRFTGVLRQRLPDFEESTHFHQGSRGSRREIVAWSFVAALIDGLLLFASSCFFLFALSLLMRVQMISLKPLFGDSFFHIGLVVGGLLVCSYMILLRVFLGFTIGEWACGLRLGSLKQRLNKYYGLKVIARMAVVCLTGGFVLPLLSVLIGRDVPGVIVKLPLVRL